MADCDRCVVPLEHLRHRRPHDLAPAEDDGVGAGDGRPRAADQVEAAGRGAREEAWRRGNKTIRHSGSTWILSAKGVETK